MRTRILTIAQLAIVGAGLIAWAVGALSWLNAWALLVAAPYASGVVRLYRRESPEWDAELALVLGMAGTVAGLIVMVAGIDAEAIRQLDTAVQLVANALVGLGIALHTTLVGIVVWVALIIQHAALPGR